MREKNARKLLMDAVHAFDILLHRQGRLRIDEREDKLVAAEARTLAHIYGTPTNIK